MFLLPLQISENIPAAVPVAISLMQVFVAILPGLLVAVGALFKPSTFVKIVKLLWKQKLPVAGILCVVFALRWGMPKLFPSHYATAQSGDGDSTMYRGGPERRGWRTGAKDPTVGGRIWSFDQGCETVFCSPTVTGKYVYAGSVDYGFGKDSGSLFCLDAESGKEIWRDDVGDLRSIFSSPALYGDYLVCGEGLHVIDDARVVCLDRRTGKKIWTLATKQHVESSVCIDDGRVYFGAGADGYYCLKLEGDGNGKPLVLWHKTEKDGFIDCEGAPLAFKGKVYVTMGVKGEAVSCLDAKSGDELWRLKTTAPVFTPPVLADGKLFVGMGHGDFIKSAEELPGSPPKEGELWCIDVSAAKPEKLWSYQTERTIMAAPAVANGLVYVCSVDGWIHCLDLGGHLRKKWNAHAPIMTSPAIAEGHVYFSTRSGILYALDAKTLAPTWTQPLWTKPPKSGDVNFFSSPTVANGHVYVGSTKDGLLCIGQPDKPAEPVWAGHLGGSGQSGFSDQIPMAKTYEFVSWTYPKAEDGSSIDSVITAPLAYLHGKMYLPMLTKGKPSLVQLSLKADEVGREPTIGWTFACDQIIAVSPAAKGNLVFISEGKSADAGRKLRAIDSATGAEKWSVPIETSASGHFLLDGKRLFAAASANGLSSYDSETGTNAWTYSAGASIGMPAESDGRIAVVLQDPARVAVLDAESGAELWNKTMTGAPTTGAIFIGAAICVGTQQGVTGFDVVDGSVLWSQSEAGSVALPLIACDPYLAAVSSDGKLTLLDAQQNGKMVKFVNGVQPGCSPLLESDGLHYFRAGKLNTTTLDERVSQDPCLKLVGNLPTTPAIVAEGHLFFGSARGLLCAKPKE